MERRQFTREFKLEAVRLIKQRGVSYTQASEDLGVHPTQLRNWVKQLADDPQHAFPGQGQMKPEQLEIAQLKREVIRLKAEQPADELDLLHLLYVQLEPMIQIFELQREPLRRQLPEIVQERKNLRAERRLLELLLLLLAVGAADLAHVRLQGDLIQGDFVDAVGPKEPFSRLHDALFLVRSHY